MKCRRNNCNNNPTFASPLAALGTNGNHDARMMINGVGGAVEYVTGYATKAEAPDSQLTKNMLVRMLSKQAISSGNNTHAYRHTHSLPPAEPTSPH
jgi:hypothetical protein